MAVPTCLQHATPEASEACLGRACCIADDGWMETGPPEQEEELPGRAVWADSREMGN